MNPLGKSEHVQGQGPIPGQNPEHNNPSIGETEKKVNATIQNLGQKAKWVEKKMSPLFKATRNFKAKLAFVKNTVLRLLSRINPFRLFRSGSKTKNSKVSLSPKKQQKSRDPSQTTTPTKVKPEEKEHHIAEPLNHHIHANGNKFVEHGNASTKQLLEVTRPKREILTLTGSVIKGFNANLPLKLELKRIIKEYVGAFLEPYLSEEITPENEDKNRGKLVDNFIRDLSNAKGINLEKKKSQIRRYVFKFYVEKCADKLFIQYYYPRLCNRKAAKERAIQDLIHAFTHAFPIDFGNISQKRIEYIAKQAIELVWQKADNASVRDLAIQEHRRSIMQTMAKARNHLSSKQPP